MILPALLTNLILSPFHAFSCPPTCQFGLRPGWDPLPQPIGTSSRAETWICGPSHEVRATWGAPSSRALGDRTCWLDADLTGATIISSWSSGRIGGSKGTRLEDHWSRVVERIERKTGGSAAGKCPRWGLLDSFPSQRDQIMSVPLPPVHPQQTPPPTTNKQDKKKKTDFLLSLALN